MAIKKTKPVIPAYTKTQLLQSKRYENRRDLLGAILLDSATYTHEEVEKLIEKTMKGKVK